MSDANGKTSKKKVPEPHSNWKRLRSMTDKQIRVRLRSDPDVHPTDDTFWAKSKLVMPRSKKNASLETGLDTVEAQPGLKRMMRASAADIEAGRVLNSRQLLERRKQTEKAKDSR